MSTQTIVLNTGQQAIINTDLSKIFVWNNRYEKGSYNNGGYDSVTLQAGTVMGRITATGKLTPLRSDASDGSQIPVGILLETQTVAAGDTVDVFVCTSGDVVSGKLVFAKSGDTLDTIISSRRLRDRIAADTVGINLIDSDELTATDNQ